MASHRRPVIALEDHDSDDTSDGSGRHPSDSFELTAMPTRHGPERTMDSDATAVEPDRLRPEDATIPSSTRSPRSRSRVRMASSVDRAQADKSLAQTKDAAPNGDDMVSGMNALNGDGQETTSQKEQKTVDDQETKRTEADSCEPRAPANMHWWDRVLDLQFLAWAWPKLKDYEAMKPVIRCAVAAWIGLLFLLIHPVEAVLGQAAFFGLVVAYIAPPSAPFVQVLEQYAFLFFFVGLSWAWVCLAAWFVSLARKGTVNEQLLQQLQQQNAGLAATNPQQYNRLIIFSGTYIEAGPAVISAIMLGIGTGFFAWLKIHTAPNPFTFALVLACVLADVSLTIIHLFPYDYYTSGLLFMLPMSVQLGVGLLCSILIFPQSVSSSFTSKLAGIIGPLAKSCQELQAFMDNVGTVRQRYHSAQDVNDEIPAVNLFRCTTMTDEEKMETLKRWAAKGINVRDNLVASAAGLGPCKAQEGYLSKEISYSRYSGQDLKAVFTGIQTLQLRSGGLAFFFDVINGAIQHSHLDSSAFSVHAHKNPESHLPSPSSSRPASIHGSNQQLTPDGHLSGGRSSPLPSPLTPNVEDRDPLNNHDEHASRHRHQHHHFPFSKRLHLPSFKHSTSELRHEDRISSHASLMDHLRKIQAPVGVYESAKYMNVETSQDGDVDHIIQQLLLLAQSASPLVTQLSTSLEGSMAWLRQIKQERDRARNMFSMGMSAEKREQASLDHAKMVQELEKAIDAFKTADRLLVLEPYRHLLDPTHPPAEDVNYRTLKHRALFWDFLFSYHLIEFGSALLALLKTMQTLETQRQKTRWWWPKLSIPLNYFGRSDDAADSDGLHDDVDPDQEMTDGIKLGRAKRRDPDAQPFETPILNALGYIDKLFDIFSNKEFLFAIKAGLLTVLVALPAYVPSSARFFYYNRGLWVIIMAQLTLSLYSGETTTAWWVRIRASFAGCVVGLVMWYIGSGSGKGNAYGIAAVCAVAFPALMLVRVHHPGSPLAAILFTVSAAIIVGYSWLNATLIQATNATWGWDVAWRRLVCVVIGITAAWIFAMLPPATSGKVSLRSSYARTVKNIGNLFCDIISEACDQHPTAHPAHDNTRETVLAMKRKLIKLGTKHAAIRFEFSFKGVWPAARYKALQDACIDLVSLLSQLHHVFDSMPYAWRKAVLVRTRLMDPQFIGDVLAVLSMTSSSLRAGTPLPQITPCPLVERLYQKKYGLTVAHADGDSDDIPESVTVDVLESEEYLKYALATTTVFSIIRRFDRLLLITKTIVGEDFHVDHLDLKERYA